MGMEDKASRKFKEIAEDAERQHKQDAKNYLENFAKAKKIAEGVGIVEMLKKLERVISKERDVQATQVWWTNKAVTYPQSNPVSVHSIGHLEVTPTPPDSRVFIPKGFGQWRGLPYIYHGLYFKSGLRWVGNEPGKELESRSISMIGACVDENGNIMVWPSTEAGADYNEHSIDQDFGIGKIKIKILSPLECESSRILEDALIDSLTHPGQVVMSLKNYQIAERKIKG